jgi:hypothetical protein
MHIINERNLAIGAILTAAALVAVFAFTTQSDAAIDANLIARASHASTTVPTTGFGTILATSTGRTYAHITNDSAVNTVYLSFGSRPTMGMGIALPPRTTLEIDDRNLFLGAVYGVASTSATNVSTFEGYYR